MIAFSRNLTQQNPGSTSNPYTQREHAGVWKTGILHKNKGKCQKNFLPGAGAQAASFGGASVRR
jgi:hypothetical protein